MTETSPFGKASVMSGYPLDKREKDAVKKTLKATQSGEYSAKAAASSGKKFHAIRSRGEQRNRKD